MSLSLYAAGLVGIKTITRCESKFLSRRDHWNVSFYCISSGTPQDSKQTQNMCITFVQCRHNVGPGPASPTPFQHRYDTSHAVGCWSSKNAFLAFAMDLYKQISVDYFKIYYCNPGNHGTIVLRMWDFVAAWASLWHIVSLQCSKLFLKQLYLF